MKLPSSIFWLVAPITIMAGCEKKSSSSQDLVNSTPLGTEVAIEAVNALAAAYPGSLALSVFPQSDAAALRLTADVEDPNKDLTVQEKIEESQSKLKGEGDCLNLNMFKPLKAPTPVTCYEFDSDMNPSRFTGGPGTTQDYGTTDGTNGDGEACLVSFTRSEVNEAVQAVDKALALISGMLCQAKKDGEALEMPAVGEELDLKSSFENAAGDDMPVTTAKIERLEDIDGLPVYSSEVVLKDPSGNEMETHLVHSPGEDGTANGTLWLKHNVSASATADGGQDPNNSANKNFVMSTNYNRVLDEAGKLRMRFEVRRAAIVNTIEPFTEEGLVNYAGLPDDASNEQVHAINYVSFDMDPETNAGNLSYWKNPGGSLNESARGFLFNVEAGDDGLLKGCGVSGATKDVSIRKALATPSEANTLKPVRFWHPREDQNTNPDKDSRYAGNEGNLITEQCFKQNAEGVYVIDSEKTTHERGYDVIATTASDVIPPKPPEGVLEGGFVKP